MGNSIGERFNFFLASPIKIPLHLLRKIDIGGDKFHHLEECLFYHRLLFILLGSPFLLWEVASGKSREVMIVHLREAMREHFNGILFHFPQVVLNCNSGPWMLDQLE